MPNDSLRGAGPDRLTMTAAAEVADMSYLTFKRYRARGVVPQPDGFVTRSPWWHRSTIEAWAATRRRYRTR